jgi:hypothetical protein
MLARAKGRVVEITSEHPDLQELVVEVSGQRRSAIAYSALVGRVRVGEMVLLNTWAVELDLGTGGADFVIASEDQTTVDAAPVGHVMKLRYTPLQQPVLAAEAPESTWHSEVAGFQSLEMTPVVCAELHSQLPAIAAAAKWETHGAARVAYVMTDEAALPLAYSHLVRDLREKGLIDVTITSGQAFGGDYEAVNLYSALAVAKVAGKADIIIVGQGPGNTGTETPLGFSGIAQGIALNAVAALDGTPIIAARLSFADRRPRHFGLSHHTRTVLERVVLVPILVPIPRLPDVERYFLEQAIESGDLVDRHDFITVDANVGLEALLRTDIPVTTMGRTISEERAFFLAAAAAGLLAGQWIGDMVPREFRNA